MPRLNLRCWLGVFAAITWLDLARAEELPRAWSQGVLGHQAEVLRLAWNAEGRALRSRPRFLEQGETIPIYIPDPLLEEGQDDCITVAVLGTQNISFLLLFEIQDKQAGSNWPVPSSAGLAQVTRCGKDKSVLSALKAKMRSRRGVLDFVLTSGKLPPINATALLPGRDPGMSQPSPHVGPRPALAPLETRVLALRKRHEGASAQNIRISDLQADSSGRGSAIVQLTEGCHRLDFLAPTDPNSPPDIDAALYSLSTGELLEQDEEQSGQATLTHCVAPGERLRIEFSGATPGSELSLVTSEWSLPDGLPREWGSVARAKLARALFDEKMPNLYQKPVFSALGVRGETALILSTEPSACYQVVVAPIRGELQRLTLQAGSVGQRRFSFGMKTGQGSALNFCAEGETKVPLQIQATGNGLAWILGLWRRSDEIAAQ